MVVVWISFVVVAASFAAMAVGGLWGRPFVSRGCARGGALGVEDPRCGSCPRASFGDRSLPPDRPRVGRVR